MNGSVQRTIPNVMLPFRSMIPKSRSAAYYGSEYQVRGNLAPDILHCGFAAYLMKLDEFGSVQQHLQPRHIWGLPVPVPDSWEQVSPIIGAGKGMISAMEQTSLADESLRTNGFDSLIE